MPVDSTPIQEDDLQFAPPVVANDAKKKVVAILLGLLIFAILTQPDKETGEQASATPASLKSYAAGVDFSAAAARLDEDAAGQFAEVRELSRLSMEDVLGSTAFRQRTTPAPVIVAPPVRVQAIYGSSVSQSALVGSSIVRSGQPLPNGRRALNVTLDGVQVAP